MYIKLFNTLSIQPQQQLINEIKHLLDCLLHCFVFEFKRNPLKQRKTSKIPKSKEMGY